MQVDALLCNHAEAVNNLLYIAGGGINISRFQLGAPPPYGVAVGIGIQVTVPWTQTNQQHAVKIELIAEDGEAVTVPGPTGPAPLVVELAFNVGRPVGVHPGDDQTIALAANLAGVPFPAAGKYEFILRVDGNTERRLPMRLEPTQGGQFTFG
jgi:hypothetical protein